MCPAVGAGPVRGAGARSGARELPEIFGSRHSTPRVAVGHEHSGDEIRTPGAESTRWLRVLRYVKFMLARFEVRNFRSIAQPLELSLVAVDHDREAAREVPSLGESLLTRAAVYGPNASGKSNVLAALVWLVDAVRQSLRLWEDEIPVDPFCLGSEVGKSSEFTVDYVVDGVRFEYLLEVNRAEVVREHLFHYPNKKPTRIFERERDQVTFNRALGSTRALLELLTPTTLMLSLARRFDVPEASRFAEAFIRTTAFGRLPSRRRFVDANGMGSTLRIFDQRGSLGRSPEGEITLFEDGQVDPRSQALDLLKLADLGVSDVVVERDEIPSRNGELPPRTVARPRLVHGAGDRAVALDLHQESEGTRTWFALIGPVLTALRNGAPIIFDELDASLHPVLSAELLRIFQDKATNPFGAQLIFTSHDTSLLKHLNRDEVWLTQKRTDGSTELGALADFAGERVRKSANIESAYLHGRYGAIPDIDPTRLRALGLVG